MIYPDYLDKIKEVVHAVARYEDAELRRFSGKGILSMPEIAFVHQVAKALSSRSGEIFGVPTIGWEMNKNIGSGLTDLSINPFDETKKKVAIEFKIGGKDSEWLADLENLQKLPSTEYDRLFCALADVFVHDLSRHSRIVAVDEYSQVKTSRIGNDFDFFSTRTSFVKQTCCVVTLWWVRA